MNVPCTEMSLGFKHGSQLAARVLVTRPLGDVSSRAERCTDSVLGSQMHGCPV
jgi:hypothetical protein